MAQQMNQQQIQMMHQQMMQQQMMQQQMREPYQQIRTGFNQPMAGVYKGEGEYHAAPFPMPRSQFDQDLQKTFGGTCNSGMSGMIAPMSVIHVKNEKSGLDSVPY